MLFAQSHTFLFSIFSSTSRRVRLHRRNHFDYIAIMAVMIRRQSSDCQMLRVTCLSQQQQFPNMKAITFIWFSYHVLFAEWDMRCCLYCQSTLSWVFRLNHAQTLPGCYKINHTQYASAHQAIGLWFCMLRCLPVYGVKIIGRLKTLTSSGHTEQTVHLEPW